MLILSLDTTTRAGSAAVLDDDRVVAVAAGDDARTHGERLPGELARVLAEAGVSLAAVDLLAVASGPGAFTGLRIGLAAMQGLAMAIERPVVGVSALEALAASAFAELGQPQARIGCWMDAARGEVFAALYDAGGGTAGTPMLTEVRPPEVAPPDEMAEAWRADRTPGLIVCGDGAVRYAAHLGADARILPPPLLAPAIARLARRVFLDKGPSAPHQLQPLYVRRPDAERIS